MRAFTLLLFLLGMVCSQDTCRSSSLPSSVLPPAGFNSVWAGIMSRRPQGTQCPPNGHMNECSYNCSLGKPWQTCCTNTTLVWWGDRCLCPYDCMDCHGGEPGELPTAPDPGGPPNPEGFHFCLCPAGMQGIDCRDCKDEGGCPSPQVCNHDVFFNFHKVYDCLPSANIRSFFPGRFVWEAQFPPDGGPGNLTMQLYQFNASGPVVANCTMTDCTKTYGDAGEQMTCQNSQCCTRGWMVEELAFIFNMIYGPSLVTMSPSGQGAMHQLSGCMPLALEFDCTAYSCEYPGQNIPPMTTGQKVGIAAAGFVAFLLVVIIVISILVRRYKLQQRFLNLGKHRLPISLSWKNVSCSIDLGRGRYLQTLQGVSGHAYPGTILALLGESGAGKTSLLDTLAGRKTFGVLHGSILVNGRARGTDWRRISGYCMQDDMFVATLTVKECVLFSARMRLPALMNDAERELRAMEALEAMGLTDVQNTLVGDYAHKGISGGERKRLAIACELVTNPSCLFLDEPTSGLDSANALRVVKCLHNLAHTQGINVVFSIHQPDSAIFSYFDNVHVLAKGRLVYSGPGKKLISFFEPLGFNCPANYNPADFVIHTVTAIQDTDELDRIAQHNVNVALVPEKGAMHNQREFLDTLQVDPTMNVNWDGKRDMEAVHVGQSTPLNLEEEALLEKSREIGEHAQSWLMQFLYLARRSLIATWRSNLITTQYIMVVGCGLLLGTLFFNLSLETTGVQNRTGVIQFVVILLTFLSLTSIDTFVTNRQLYLREKSSGYFSSSAYFVSLVLTDVIFLRLVPPILLASVMYWMCGLHPGTTHFLWFTGLLVCTSFTGVAICLLISVVTPTVAMGNLVGILILLFSILFEGILINQSTIPAWMVFIKYVSFVNYAFEALMINEFADLILQANIPGSAQTYPVNGAYFLVEIGLNPNNFYFDLYILIAMGMVLFVAAFVLLTSVKEQR